MTPRSGLVMGRSRKIALPGGNSEKSHECIPKIRGLILLFFVCFSDFTFFIKNRFKIN
jgi:hypothetical protein